MSMEIFNAERKRNTEINNLLQRIKYKVDKLQPREEYVSFPVSLLKGGEFKYLESISNQTLFHELKDWGAIEIIERNVEEMNKTLKESAGESSWTVEGILVKPIEPEFSRLCKEYERKVDEKLRENNKEGQPSSQDKSHLKSIHLVTTSLEPTSVIFLVLDELFEMPIRCAVWNDKGKVVYIKKLYDIAYFVNAPGKKVDYDRNLADSINNGLFRRRRVAKYMKTNKFIKPTLVQKSEDKRSLVLKGEVPVLTVLAKSIPLQYQSLYIDKTT